MAEESGSLTATDDDNVRDALYPAYVERINIVIQNRRARFPRGISAEQHEVALPWWSYRPPGYAFSPAYRRHQWDGRIRMLRNGSLPAGLFLATYREIEEKTDLRFSVQYEDGQKLRIREHAKPASLQRSDRPYQDACISAMIGAAETGGGLVLAATGVGKTFMAAMFFARVEGSVCFIVDELMLLEQAKKEIENLLGEEVGYVGNQVFEPRRVTIATVQTLKKREKSAKFQEWTRKLELLLIDEVHVAMNRRHFSVVEKIQPRAVFGLTATLELTKQAVRTRAYALCGPVAYTYPIQTGVQEGYLSDGAVVQVRVPKTCSGRYQAQLEEAILNGKTRNRFAVEIAKTGLQCGKHAVMLVERRAHLLELSQRLTGIVHKLVWGDASIRERVKATKKFENQELRLLLATKVFKKGINVKRIDLIVDVAGLGSKNDAVQKFGRGVRLCDGKTGLIYVDMGDKNNRFEKTARSRVRAFRKQGIPVQIVDWTPELTARQVLEIGEKMLMKRKKERGRAEQPRSGSLFP